MKTHSPSRTYNQGDKCSVYHTINGVTQRYTFESLGVQRGSFAPAMWRNLTPRVWRVSDFDVNDFVYEGDTVFDGQIGYKNSTTGVKPLREFILPVENINGNVRIYAERQREYLLEFRGLYVDGFFLRNSKPTWSGFSKSENYAIICEYIADRIFIKALCSAETYDLYGNRLTSPLRITRSVYEWNFITTPDSGVIGDQTVIYNLPNTEGDYYYFILSTSANILSVERLALNTNP